MFTFLLGDSQLCLRKEMCDQKFAHISMVVELKGLFLGTVL
jgi:hypothetical protein